MSSYSEHYFAFGWIGMFIVAHVLIAYDQKGSAQLQAESGVLIPVRPGKGLCCGLPS